MRPAVTPSRLVADQVGEGAGEVVGPGDVRAREPDLTEALVPAVGEGLAGPHDPVGDFAGVGDVGLDRIGGARAQGGEVFADGLAAAAVAEGLDLQEQPGGSGSGTTCWRRLREWSEAGVWQRLHEMLPAELRAAGILDLSRASVDSSHLRAMKGSAATGSSPVDGGKTGLKHHVIVEVHGIPLGATLTGGNRNDVTQLIPLIRAVPPIRGKRGQPLRRPKRLYADHGYDHESYRDQVRRFEITPHITPHITPRIARRGTEHGSGLGVHRWVVQGAIALHHTRLRRHLLATTEDLALIPGQSKVESHVANSRQAQGGANARQVVGAGGRKASFGRTALRWNCSRRGQYRSR
ncbi:IS5 family transposase [Streptomyces monashensis]|uniref:IS5 family transposase n=1 Tax=Streptomyces monashensis TaxID=1678012 RepID=UPI003401E00E